MRIDLDELEVKINRVETAIALPMEKFAEFCQKWNLTELARFGSILRDDFNAHSDVDVRVQFHPEAHPTLFDLAEMEEELKQLFQRDVDLMTRKGIETSRNYLRRQAILSSAQVIYGTGCSIVA
ncbi:nucleotidyltransferase family protein [Oscillatoria sp. HE19RPO]|uniref:nucleotidyltransferase family protein n=1 Tax=Oscillatoria sp. HE19RPO TaxID=2954806 RepID=UPI0020C1FF4A|nr:nucleotidyltransferase domain-containing protein [Oscillatoria sp. HE19RPO]